MLGKCCTTEYISTCIFNTKTSVFGHLSLRGMYDRKLCVIPEEFLVLFRAISAISKLEFVFSSLRINAVQLELPIK